MFVAVAVEVLYNNRSRIKKIVAFVGSRNPASTTLKLVEDICSALKNFYITNKPEKKVEFDIFTPNNCKILPDDGTASAFFTGVDKIEEAGLDDSNMFKKKIEECDYLILASPTYAHQVSGDMKILIDRLTYWNHIFHLANKPGRIIVTASGNGFLKVAAYIRQIFENCGVVFGEDIIQTKVKLVGDDEIEKIVKDITNEINEQDKVRIPSTQAQANFQQLKIRYSMQDEELFEPIYWRKNGMLNCETLQEYYEQVANRKSEVKQIDDKK